MTEWLPDYSMDRAEGILAAKAYLAKRRAHHLHRSIVAEILVAALATSAVVAGVFSIGLYFWSVP